MCEILYKAYEESKDKVEFNEVIKRDFQNLFHNCKEYEDQLDGSDENCSFIITSLAYTHVMYEWLGSIFDEICIQKTEIVENPNTGNKIRMWTF